MADEKDFEVFISWSGALAKQVARVLHQWLPTMFDRMDPWFSDTDIPAGATWFGDIQARLNTSDYGIVVITTANWQRPWLNFEAGSLSKKLKEDTNKVTPVLVNFENIAQLTGHPLEQYNAVMLDKDGMWRLCSSVALTAARNVEHVQQRFEQMWPNLRDKIEAAKVTTEEEQPPAPEVSETKRLDALTASIRSLEATVTQLARQQTLSGGSIVLSGNAETVKTWRRRNTLASTLHAPIITSDKIKGELAAEVARIASDYAPVKAVAIEDSSVGPQARIDLGQKLTIADATQLVAAVDELGVMVDIRPLVADDTRQD